MIPSSSALERARCALVLARFRYSIWVIGMAGVLGAFTANLYGEGTFGAAALLVCVVAFVVFLLGWLARPGPGIVAGSREYLPGRQLHERLDGAVVLERDGSWFRGAAVGRPPGGGRPRWYPFVVTFPKEAAVAWSGALGPSRLARVEVSGMASTVLLRSGARAESTANGAVLEVGAEPVRSPCSALARPDRPG
jgi:hypothetical protein